MKTGRTLPFAALLIAGVAAAVSTLVAQNARPTPQARDEFRDQAGSDARDEFRDQAREEARAGARDRSRVLLLDGPGSRIGVVVRDEDGGTGVRIEDVERGGAADRAGVREGDRVIEFDGERVRSARQLTRLVQETPDGRAVPMVVERDGGRQTLTVTPEARTTFRFEVDGDRIARDIEREMRRVEPGLREFRLDVPRFRMPRFDLGPDVVPGLPFSSRGRLGVQIENLAPQLADYFGVKDGGVLVSSVTPDSPAGRAGLKAGDVITSIAGDPVRDASELVDEIEDIDSGEVSIEVVRDRQTLTLTATLPASDEPTGGRVRLRRPA